MASFIDAGRQRKTPKGLLGDKVSCTDPAVAPGHTDAEASGAPCSDARSQDALEAQRNVARQANSTEQLQSAAAAMPHERMGEPAGWKMAGVVTGLVALGIAAAVLTH